MPSAPAGRNSPQPSTAWPPMPTAWFFKHSLYLGFLWDCGSTTTAAADTGEGILGVRVIELELPSES